MAGNNSGGLPAGNMGDDDGDSFCSACDEPDIIELPAHDRFIHELNRLFQREIAQDNDHGGVLTRVVAYFRDHERRVRLAQRTAGERWSVAEPNIWRNGVSLVVDGPRFVITGPGADDRAEIVTTDGDERESIVRPRSCP